MYRLLLLISLSFLLSIQAHASLVNTAFIQNDLRILDELDIDSNYLTDYKLQKVYKKLLKLNQKDYTKKLNNAHLFVPQIKKILKENNIPSAFLYLVMAESNFILNAKSHKKAMGLWQFMPRTGQKFGLITNEYIDERMDIIKSTQAAVKYLKYLHKMFGKWYIAAIAYNCGEGRIIEGITRATLDMYCEDKSCRKNKQISKYRKTIRLYQQKQLKFKEIYKIYKIVKKWKYKPNINHILTEQKGLRRQYIPDESRGYIRKIISLAMMNNSEFLILDDNSHLLNRGITDPIAAVKIKGGTHLLSIAQVIGISKERLHAINLHIKQNIIPPEEKEYNIYIPYSTLARFNANIKNLKPTRFEVYKVKGGDSLGAIARRYKINYKLIKKFNKLKSNFLSVNQKLIIPVDPQTIKRDKIYFVKSGDSLGKIAKKYKISLNKLMKDNNIKTSMIKIGDKIVVKYN
ncbi:MAG: LysM peptidoglycan-binding domain-containing protein [Arcobacteraceae bacterium]|nr:LysM peptidoglycan-binding domain-containing protein [Arcobacteraceae bacterium]